MNRVNWTWMDLECTVVTSISKILKMFLVKELYNYSFLRSGWTT